MALEPAGVSLVAEGAAAFQSAMGAAGSAVSGFGDVAGHVAGGLGTFAKAAAGVAAVAGGALAAGLGAGAAAGLSFNNSMEQARARINAFTKDGAATTEILDMVAARAAKTPFAFEEMANAAAALGPVAKSSGQDLEALISQAEILAASNPAEGLEGAAFAIKEAVSGDFTSAIERFNLSRQYINQLKDQGVPALEALGKAMAQAGYDADLVSSLANTASGRLSTFTDTFTTLAGTATQPIFDAFSEGLGLVNGQLEGATPLLTDVATSIGESLVPAAQWLGGAMTDVTEGALTMIAVFQEAGGGVDGLSAAFASGVQTVLDTVAELLGIDPQQFADGWQGVGDEVIGILLNLAGRFGEFAMGVGQAIVEAAPGVLAKLGELGQSLLGWAAEQAPGWLASLAQLGAGLGQWVLDALPGLLGKLADARLALVSWVLDSLPEWAGKLAELGTALYQWVVDALPGLGTKLGEVAAVLIAKTGEFIAVVGPKLLELGGRFVMWIAEEVLPKLPGQLATIAGALATGIGNFLAEIGPPLLEVARAFTEWVATEVLPKAPGELAKIGSAIVDGISTFAGNVVSEATSLGGDLIAGFVQGVLDGAGALYNTIAGVIGKALGAGQEAADSHSPSRLFARELGAPITQGIAQGMLSSIDVLLDAAGQLSWAVLDEAKKFAATIEKAVGPLLAAAYQGAADFARGQIGALDQLDALAPDNGELNKRGEATKKIIDQLNGLGDEYAKKRADLEGQIAKLQSGVDKDAADAERKRLEDELDRLEGKKKGADADLAEQRRRLAYTAANNIDPAKRAEAQQQLDKLGAAGATGSPQDAARAAAIKQRLAQMDAANAAQDQAARQAQLDQIKALQAELAGLGDAEKQRRAELKADADASVAAYEREQAQFAQLQTIRDRAQTAIAAAQKEALKLSDPAERAAFLDLRTKQIIDQAKLEQKLATAATDAERASLEERMGLLRTAQQNEFLLYQQQAADRQRATAAALRDAQDAAKQLANLVYFTQADVNGVGSDAVKGIGAGMVSALGGLQTTLSGVLNDVLAAARAALGIASPSKVFAEQIGAPAAAGILAGFQAELARSRPALEASVGAIVTPVARAALAPAMSYSDNRRISIDARGAAPGVERSIAREVGAVLRQSTTRSDLIRRTR